MSESLFTESIRWGQAAPLLLTSLAIMGTPGPATISLTAAGSAYGLRRCVGYLTGIIAGTTAVLLAVASGVTVTLLAIPALRVALVAIAVVYILWLACHIATAPPLAAQPAAAKAPSLAGGTLLGIANPKAWIAIAAVFASARLAASATADAAAKVALLTVMIVVINATWLVAGAALAPLLRHPIRARVINAVLAAALVGAAALTVFR
jgi:threonine/homoserine/homoserine lactone efflux protein